MSVDTALARFRKKQAEQFDTDAEVWRPDGEPVFDPDTEVYDQPQILVYEGPCKVRPDSNRSTDDTEAGETLIGKPDFAVKLPVDADVQRDDVIVVTASKHDPGMVGHRYTVRKCQNDEWKIAQVAICEEILAPLLNEGGS